MPVAATSASPLTWGFLSFQLGRCSPVPLQGWSGAGVQLGAAALRSLGVYLGSWDHPLGSQVGAGITPFSVRGLPQAVQKAQEPPDLGSTGACTPATCATPAAQQSLCPGQWPWALDCEMTT